MRRRRLATNSNAALTVSFLVVVPSSLAASSRASSFKSIIVFIYSTVQSRIYSAQHIGTRAEVGATGVDKEFLDESFAQLGAVIGGRATSIAPVVLARGSGCSRGSTTRSVWSG